MTFGRKLSLVTKHGLTILNRKRGIRGRSGNMRPPHLLKNQRPVIPVLISHQIETPKHLSNCVILLHDDAILQDFRWEALEYLPYSPDLSPHDFNVFGPLKRAIRWHKFTTDDEVCDWVQAWIRQQPSSFFNDGIDRCQVIYSQFGLAIHQNDHQARRRFVEWAQNEIAVVPDFQKRILFSDEAHFWLNGYVNKQNCRIWSDANPQVYVETPLHPEKLTVWCALWAGGILLQKR
ncbi:mariner Mos1 transposase [Trichonephila clavipes]|nr:mariner Mos1 transposase [Trichonephila clavipes]